MWPKAAWMGHPMRLELTRVGLLVELANRYTTRGALAASLKSLPAKAHFFYWRVYEQHVEQHVDWLTLQEWNYPTHSHEWCPFIYVLSTKLLRGLSLEANLFELTNILQKGYSIFPKAGGWPSNGLVSYSSLAEMQSMYYTAQAEWDNSIKHQSFIYIELMSKQFYFKQFSLALAHSLILFDP